MRTVSSQWPGATDVPGLSAVGPGRSVHVCGEQPKSPAVAEATTAPIAVPLYCDGPVG